MNFEKFKRELLEVISQSQEASGKQIQLLERDGICTDWRISVLLGMGNRRTCVDGGRFREDILCITWNIRGQARILHWGMEKLYEQFCREGWQSVLPEIVCKLRQHDKRAGYRESLGEMIVKPLSYLSNRDMLEDSIYWKFGDIALVLYLLAGGDSQRESAVRVSRELADKWNVQDDILLTNALLHSSSAMPPRFYRNRDARGWGYRLTNADGADGALSLFYPGVREHLASLLGGDYYVGFFNVNEAVIYPVKKRILAELKTAVRYANVVFGEQERLTDRVYRYSCSQGRLIEV